ncbi:MAG: hypothetical protein R2708_05180 [Vicinamibacterales bacterium]
MMQNRHALLALDRLLRQLDATRGNGRRIIEAAGTGPGAGVLLRLHTMTTGTSYPTTSGTAPRRRGRSSGPLGVDASSEDPAEAFTAAEVARDIQRPGVTLLVCDGPDKVADVKTFAPYLKTGDLIMAHDYAVSGDDPEQRLRGQLWNWCEIDATSPRWSRRSGSRRWRPICWARRPGRR